MDIKNVYLVTFSPTHTSKRIGEAIVRGLEMPSVTMVDVTLQSAGNREIPSDALAVFAVPVYGGHVAPLALERMAGIRSDGVPAVIVVVYGNRAYEKALAELDAYVSGLGFRTISGATFVGEHSFCDARYPIAAGRPDEDDLLFAGQYGMKVRAKIAAATDATTLYGVDVSRIQRPSQPFFPLLRFLRRVVKLRKGGVPIPPAPQTDAERCTHCGYCTAHCPAGAIVEGREQETLPGKCIRCCACVKQCPSQARTYDTPYAPLLADCFKRPKENRIII